MILGEFIIGAGIGFIAGVIFRSVAGPSRLPEVTTEWDCPFCAATIEDDAHPVEIGGAARQWALGCDVCGCVGPMRETREEAREAWRDRAGKAVGA